MRRYETTSRIFLILSVVNFALAAPVAVRGIYEVGFDMLDVTKGRTGVSQKRMYTWDKGSTNTASVPLGPSNDMPPTSPESSTELSSAPPTPEYPPGFEPQYYRGGPSESDPHNPSPPKLEANLPPPAPPSSPPPPPESHGGLGQEYGAGTSQPHHGDLSGSDQWDLWLAYNPNTLSPPKPEADPQAPLPASPSNLLPPGPHGGLGGQEYGAGTSQPYHGDWSGSDLWEGVYNPSTPSLPKSEANPPPPTLPSNPLPPPGSHGGLPNTLSAPPSSSSPPPATGSPSSKDASSNPGPDVNPPPSSKLQHPAAEHELGIFLDDLLGGRIRRRISGSVAEDAAQRESQGSTIDPATYISDSLPLLSTLN
jgi:hypothetical protein